MRTITNAPRTHHRLPYLAAVLLLAAGSFACDRAVHAAGVRAAPGPERLEVLFLGGQGHHEPAARARQVLPYLASRGINLFYTERLDVLDAERLRRYDAVVLYGNSPALTREQETALLNYVAEGGGLVPVHSASAMFGNSDAYVNLVGGAFKSHGVDSFRTKVLLPDHPAMRGVPDFASHDETYIHTKHNPDKVVLAVRVEDGHEEPWTWVRTHGEGRVFYTAWGHDERTWSKPGFQALLERGIRWAAGDEALASDLAPPGFEYVESTLPYYPPGVGWGVTGDPIRALQKPLTPEASMEQAVLEPGFRLELFAAEPDIVNPIDMAWDERGRLWIVETLDYPNEFEPERRGDDRIKILEDTDGDGRADEVTIFADGLNIPTSLALANGGVIVAQAPDMLFLKDTDGDDRADVKEVLFTGWGTFDTHAGPSNLRYGFDNQIWGVVGYSGFYGTVGGDSVRIVQGYYRFTPDGSAMEPMAFTNNNTWGLGFSEEGLVFGSTANGNPSNFMAIPSGYYARLKGVYPPEGSEGESAPKIPLLPEIADGDEVYPVTEDVRQVDHHGRYTSGAAHELYTARSFPREYWNRVAFVAEPTVHLLGKFVLEPDGSDFRAHNAWNMIASRDGWFAPIQARVGPDGALWMIDWYNPIIQHNPTPPGYETGEGNAYETELRDRQHSRIYRIVYDGAPEVEPKRLAGAGPGALVAALGDDNLQWRLTAQRLLVERGETDVLPELYRLVRDVRVDGLGLNVGAIHALWTMHGLGALGGGNAEALAAATAALHHPSDGVRRTALMVLPRTEATLEAVMQAGMLPDPAAPAGMTYMMGGEVMGPADPQVRLALLLAVADMPASERAGEGIAELLLVPKNANDRWIRDAATIAGARHSTGFLRRMLREELDEHRGDSLYLANIRHAIGTVTAHQAAQASSSLLDPLLHGVGAADPVLAAAFLDAVVANWPAGEAPPMAAGERAALRSASAGASDGIRTRLEALVARWGTPELLSSSR